MPVGLRHWPWWDSDSYKPPPMFGGPLHVPGASDRSNREAPVLIVPHRPQT